MYAVDKKQKRQSVEIYRETIDKLKTICAFTRIQNKVTKLINYIAIVNSS